MTASPTSFSTPRGIPVGASAARIVPVLAALGGLVLLCYGLFVTAALVNTLVMTLLLALVISPVLFALRRRGWPDWAAILGGFLVVLAITVAFVALSVVSLSQLDENLPAYQQRLNEIATNVTNRLPPGTAPAASIVTFPPDLGRQLLRALIPLAFNVASLAASLILYMFLLLYAFGEVFVVPARLRRLTGGDPYLLELLRQFGADMRSFFTLNAGIGAIAAVADVVVLFALGVDFALFFGLVAFVLSFIPNIGFIISMLAPAALALIQYGPLEALQVILAYCVINMLVDYVLRPRMIGKDLNMSQIVAFLAVIIWGALLGPTGALLCIPLTLIAKLLLEMATRTTRYSSLIVEDLPAELEDEAAAARLDSGVATAQPDGGVAAAKLDDGVAAAQLDSGVTTADAPTPTKR
jgi:predicted PurR-regulated permease PerM